MKTQKNLIHLFTSSFIVLVFTALFFTLYFITSELGQLLIQDIGPNI